MQLPGMSTEPVRVSIEVTWWPHEDSWSISRRGWRRGPSSLWELEQMECSGSPLTRSDLLEKLNDQYQRLASEVMETDDPFSTTGSFR